MQGYVVEIVLEYSRGYRSVVCSFFFLISVENMHNNVCIKLVGHYCFSALVTALLSEFCHKTCF